MDQLVVNPEGVDFIWGLASGVMRLAEGGAAANCMVQNYLSETGECRQPELGVLINQALRMGGGMLGRNSAAIGTMKRACMLRDTAANQVRRRMLSQRMAEDGGCGAQGPATTGKGDKGDAFVEYAREGMQQKFVERAAAAAATAAKAATTTTAAAEDGSGSDGSTVGGGGIRSWITPLTQAASQSQPSNVQRREWEFGASPQKMPCRVTATPAGLMASHDTVIHMGEGDERRLETSAVAAESPPGSVASRATKRKAIPGSVGIGQKVRQVLFVGGDGTRSQTTGGGQEEDGGSRQRLGREKSCGIVQAPISCQVYVWCEQKLEIVQTEPPLELDVPMSKKMMYMNHYSNAPEDDVLQDIEVLIDYEGYEGGGLESGCLTRQNSMRPTHSLYAWGTVKLLGNMTAGDVAAQYSPLTPY
jgi:hypothetical protein